MLLSWPHIFPALRHAQSGKICLGLINNKIPCPYERHHKVSPSPYPHPDSSNQFTWRAWKLQIIQYSMITQISATLNNPASSTKITKQSRQLKELYWSQNRWFFAYWNEHTRSSKSKRSWAVSAITLKLNKKWLPSSFAQLTILYDALKILQLSIQTIITSRCFNLWGLASSYWIMIICNPWLFLKISTVSNWTTSVNCIIMIMYALDNYNCFWISRMVVLATAQAA